MHSLDFDFLEQLLRLPKLWRKTGTGIGAGGKGNTLELLPCYYDPDAGGSILYGNSTPIDPTCISLFRVYLYPPPPIGFWVVEPSWSWNLRKKRRNKELFELALALWVEIWGIDTRSPDERLKAILEEAR